MIVIICGSKVWTHDLTHTKQVFYHWVCITVTDKPFYLKFLADL